MKSFPFSLRTPLLVAVPASVPSAASVSPLGTLLLLNRCGAVPPLASISVEYAWFCVAFGNTPGVVIWTA